MIHIPHIKSIIRNDMRKAKFLSLLLAASLAVTTFVGTPNVSAFWVENNVPTTVTKPSTPVKKPKLSKKKLTLRVGKTKTIKVKNGVKSAKVTWKTSKKKVVKLSKKVKQGNKASVKLKALKAGKSTITAVYKLNGKTTKLKCKVTVKKPAVKVTVPPVPVTPAPTAVVTSTPAPTNGGVTPTPTPTNGEDTPTPTLPGEDSTPTPTPTETTAPPTTTTAPPPTSTTAPPPTTPDVKDINLSESVEQKDRYDSETGELVFGKTDNEDSQTFITIPQKVPVGQTVEVTIEGTYTGDTGFRMWLGNGFNSFDQNVKIFASDFANGYFAETFSMTNQCGQDQVNGLGGTAAADKITFKAMYGSSTIKGLKVKSVKVNYGKPVGYDIDGNGINTTTAGYKDGLLELSIGQFQGPVFKNPAEEPDNYKYVTVTYTSDKDISAYVFNDQMTDGMGQTAAGQVEKGLLNKAEDESKVTYENDKMYGLKLVNVDFGSDKPMGMKIKSVVFTGPINAVEPTTTPAATPATTPAATPATTPAATPATTPAATPTPTVEPTATPIPYPVDFTTVNRNDRYDPETGKVVIDDTEGNSETYFDLPDKVAPGETVRITVKGEYTGDTGFRIWIGNGPNSFVQTPKMFAKDFASGSFETTFDLKNIDASRDAEKLTIKGTSTGDVLINGLTIESIEVQYIERPNPTPTPTPVVYDIPLSASKVQVSYVKGDQPYTDTVKLSQIDNIFGDKYEDIWSVCKKLYDMNEGWSLTKYYGDTEAEFNKRANNEAVITVKKGEESRTLNVKFTTSSSEEVSAEMTYDGDVFIAKVTSTARNTLNITEKEDEQNFAVIEKNSDGYVVTVAKALNDKYQLELTPIMPEPLVVKAEVNDVPEYIFARDMALVGVSVDIGTVEDVEWSVDGSAATIEQDPADKTKAVIKAVEAGNITVSAKVTVSDDGQTAFDTATADITVKPASVNLDLSQWDTKGSPMKVNDDGSIEITYENKNYCDAGIIIPEEYSVYKMIDISVTSYNEDGTMRDGDNQISFRNGSGSELQVTYGRGLKTFICAEEQSLGRLVINPQNSAQKQIMKIDYVTLCNPIKVNNSVVDINMGGASSKTENPDGSITLLFEKVNYTGSGFTLPEEYQDCHYIEIKGRSRNAAGDDKGTQVVVQYDDGSSQVDYMHQWNGYTPKFSVPDGRKIKYVVVQNQDNNEDIYLTLEEIIIHY